MDEKRRAREKRYRQKHHIKLRDSSRKRTKVRRLKKLGMSIEDWNNLFEKQKFLCAACGVNKSGTKYDWHTDHDHLTNNVRGILCHHCNLILGLAKDNPITLSKLIDYLRLVT